MKKLVVFSRLADPLLQQLREYFDVAYFEQIDAGNHAAFVAAVRDAHGLLGVDLTIGRALLEPARKIEAIATISVGYDSYDVEYLTERGIALSNTPDVLTETTADAIFALLLAAARRVVELAELVRAGRWQKGSIGPAQFGVNVHGKNLGIIGMGRIGQAVARRGRLGFDMPIHYFNRSRVPVAEAELGASRASLEDVLAQSDFVCNTLPLTRDTEKIIGAREFALMKPGAIFVNGGRGATVDEAALIAALQNGTILAAGLDVYEKEPLPTDSPLLTMPNVVALPHVGSATQETRHAMARLAVDNIIAAFAGRPQNIINPAVFARHAAASQ
ncbi:MAG: D-glycerate dehydrogenase [Gammaproteobacteria bacterium]|nr:D-glycerate dehydrogenase [Gammaproteobacteria bacterium]MDH5304345.1 D-glycerate dehydrogenase [Gammaproteobacteria bacterium]MDH5321416.1 D-glycerate dehydrogenase [Gammaproteobacteria bacterium]